MTTPPVHALHLLEADPQGADDSTWYPLAADAMLIERKPAATAQLPEPGDETLVIEVVGVWDPATAGAYTLLLG